MSANDPRRMTTYPSWNTDRMRPASVFGPGHHDWALSLRGSDGTVTNHTGIVDLDGEFPEGAVYSWLAHNAVGVERPAYAAASLAVTQRALIVAVGADVPPWGKSVPQVSTRRVGTLHPRGTDLSKPLWCGVCDKPLIPHAWLLVEEGRTVGCSEVAR